MCRLGQGHSESRRESVALRGGVAVPDDLFASNRTRKASTVCKWLSFFSLLERWNHTPCDAPALHGSVHSCVRLSPICLGWLIAGWCSLLQFKVFVWSRASCSLTARLGCRVGCSVYCSPSSLRSRTGGIIKSIVGVFIRNRTSALMREL